MEENFFKAKSILLEAVDTVIAVATEQKKHKNPPAGPAASSSEGHGTGSYPTTSRPAFPSSSRLLYSSSFRPALQGQGGVPTSEAVATTGISEHKRLFGFKPSRSKARGKKGRLAKRGGRKNVSAFVTVKKTGNLAQKKR